LLGRYVTCCSAAVSHHVAQLLCHMLLGCYVTCCSAAVSHAHFLLLK